MSIKSVFEVVVLIDKFRNIDLCHQGLYQLQVSCFVGEDKNLAYPVNFEQLVMREGPKAHKIVEGGVDEIAMCARTRVFLIKYAEEKVRIREVASFHIEIELTEQNFYLQIDLLHCELAHFSENSSSYESSLKKVASNVYKFSDLFIGLCQYCPISFDSQYFCSVDSVAMVAYFDYKIPASDIGQFTSALFADSKGVCKLLIGDDEINKTYEKYVNSQQKVYDELRRAIEDLSLNCFIEDIEVPKSLEFYYSEKTFAERLATREPLAIAKELLKAIKTSAASVYEAFNLLKFTITVKPHKVCKYLSGLYKASARSKCLNFIRREPNKRWEFEICSSENTKTNHKEYARLLRKNKHYRNLQPLRVQEVNFFTDISALPIVFEESSEVGSRPSTTVSERNHSKHLIVLVHGFQGNSFDLRSLHNYISLLYPNSVFLESVFNESKTEGDIRTMGARLSKEIISYMSEHFSDHPPMVSFIGHSLGGLIIRAALPQLECISDRMHLYMSLSTPHLGFMYSSKLLDAGMWFLKKLKKMQVLKQLCLEDFPNVEGTFLYLLSSEDGLQWFKFIVLVGSYQDEYAPFDSARIEVPAKASKDPERGNFYIQMAHNLLQKLCQTNTIKLDVHFKLKKSLESIIGRSAHVQLIDNENFLKILVYNYPEFFQIT